MRLTDPENNILDTVQVLINYDYRRSHNLTASDPSGHPGRIPSTQPAPLPAGIVIGSLMLAALLTAGRQRRGG